jgi:hypothetical protein
MPNNGIDNQQEVAVATCEQSIAALNQPFFSVN